VGRQAFFVTTLTYKETVSPTRGSTIAEWLLSLRSPGNVCVRNTGVLKFIPSINNNQLVVLIKIVKIPSIFCNSKLAGLNILGLKVYL
jgi:hypothetical protein